MPLSSESSLTLKMKALRFFETPQATRNITDLSVYYQQLHVMRPLQSRLRSTPVNSTIKIKYPSCFGVCPSPFSGGYIQICHVISYNATYST